MNVSKDLKMKQIYLVYYTDNYGNTELVAITDNLEKWLELNNSEREEDEYEELDDFTIKTKDVYIFND